MEHLNAQEIIEQYDKGRRDFSNVNAKGIEIFSKDLTGIIFRNADLSTGSLKDCTLNKADFTGANMKWMDLDRARFKNTILNKADLSYSRIIDAIFEKTKVTDANLSYALLFQANRGGANFGDAITNKVAWKKSDVSTVSSLEVEKEAEKTSMSLDIFMKVKSSIKSFRKTIHTIGAKIGSLLGYGGSSEKTYGGVKDTYSGTKDTYSDKGTYGTKSSYSTSSEYSSGGYGMQKDEFKHDPKKRRAGR